MKCNINIDVGKYMTKGSSDGQGIRQGTGISAGLWGVFPLQAQEWWAKTPKSG